MRSVALMMGVGVGALVCAAGALGRGGGGPAAGGDGIDWVTVGAPGNAAYPGDKYGPLAGRGSVPYEYRIGRLEVTTGQWLEFVNTFINRTASGSDFGDATFWGARRDLSGHRFELMPGFDNAALIPVYGISWRSAAMYANWLHNAKSSDLAAIASGAYDISTFSTNADGTFNDQLTHSPGAKYWIPTLDEWIKAAHYDPARYGPGQPGWWEYANSSDVPPVSGLPGVGDTATGIDINQF